MVNLVDSRLNFAFFPIHCITKTLFLQLFLKFRLKKSLSSSSVLLSDALKHKEAPIIDNSMILSETESKEREKLSIYVSIPKEVSSQ